MYLFLYSTFTGLRELCTVSVLAGLTNAVPFFKFIFRMKIRECRPSEIICKLCITTEF